MQRIVVVMCLLALFSCQDRVVCPAFQSTYILDDSTRQAYFSYIWQLDEETRAEYLAKNTSQSTIEDTLQVAVVSQPKTDYYAYAGDIVVPWRVSKRTKYGIQRRVPYPVKNYRLRTAPMENVFGPDKVSNNFVASDFTDSALDSTAIALDSLAPAPVVAKQERKYLYDFDPKDNFNVEQEYYNKYFGYKFVDNRPQRTSNNEVNELDQTTLPDSLQTKEPLFKRLFKKKGKTETASDSEIEEEIQSEEDPQVQPVPVDEKEEEGDQ